MYVFAYNILNVFFFGSFHICARCSFIRFPAVVKYINGEFILYSKTPQLPDDAQVYIHTFKYAIFTFLCVCKFYRSHFSVCEKAHGKREKNSYWFFFYMWAFTCSFFFHSNIYWRQPSKYSEPPRIYSLCSSWYNWLYLNLCLSFTVTDYNKMVWN